MRVTALSVVAVVTAAVGVAQVTSRFNDTIAAMSAALADNNAAAFLEFVDRKMPGYERLKANVEALMDQAEVHSGVDQIVEDGNEVTVEWELRIAPRGDPSRTEVRRETLRLKFERQEKRTKLVALDAIAFFEPPRLGG